MTEATIRERHDARFDIEQVSLEDPTTYELLSRGDTDKPFTIYLELLSFTLPTLLHVLPAGDPAHDGLISAYYSRDARRTMENLSGLMEAYLAARSAVIQRYHLQPMGDQAFESEIRRLIQKLS